MNGDNRFNFHFGIGIGLVLFNLFVILLVGTNLFSMIGLVCGFICVGLSMIKSDGVNNPGT